MGEKSPVYVGIKVLRSAGRQRRVYVYAALDAERELIALGHGDRNEVLAYLGGQAAAHVALTAPRGPNTGAVNDAATFQESLPFQQPGRRLNARLCEYLLQQEGLRIDSTPGVVRQCPLWAQRGFDLHRQLTAFGYTPYPNPESDRHSLETHTDGIFWRWLGGKHALPASLEGRLQRQLVLFAHQLPVPDAMDFFLEITRHKLMQGELPDQDILPFEELNALAAAQIAWLAAHQPDRLELVGDAAEGQIALPQKAAPKDL